LHWHTAYTHILEKLSERERETTPLVLFHLFLCLSPSLLSPLSHSLVSGSLQHRESKSLQKPGPAIPPHSRTSRVKQRSRLAASSAGSAASPGFHRDDAKRKRAFGRNPLEHCAARRSVHRSATLHHLPPAPHPTCAAEELPPRPLPAQCPSTELATSPHLISGSAMPGDSRRRPLCMP